MARSTGRVLKQPAQLDFKTWALRFPTAPGVDDSADFAEVVLPRGHHQKVGRLHGVKSGPHVIDLNKIQAEARRKLELDPASGHCSHSILPGVELRQAYPSVGDACHQLDIGIPSARMSLEDGAHNAGVARPATSERSAQI